MLCWLIVGINLPPAPTAQYQCIYEVVEDGSNAGDSVPGWYSEVSAAGQKVTLCLHGAFLKLPALDFYPPAQALGAPPDLHITHTALSVKGLSHSEGQWAQKLVPNKPLNSHTVGGSTSFKRLHSHIVLLDRHGRIEFAGGCQKVSSPGEKSRTSFTGPNRAGGKLLYSALPSFSPSGSI
ncbi:uncharacterized [Tachysurus ichikawai]